MALVLLRDLPGVEALEWDVEVHDRWTDELEDRAHALAVELFGISERQFLGKIVQTMMRDEADAFWAQRGWDVTDGKGNQLRVMDYLFTPLLCAIDNLHPDAKLPVGADAWAVNLEDEARRFQASRG